MTEIISNDEQSLHGMHELIIEDKKGMRKIIPMRGIFTNMSDAKRWVDKKYKGYRITAVQKGLFR